MALQKTSLGPERVIHIPNRFHNVKLLFFFLKTLDSYKLGFWVPLWPWPEKTGQFGVWTHLRRWVKRAPAADNCCFRGGLPPGFFQPKNSRSGPSFNHSTSWRKFRTGKVAAPFLAPLLYTSTETCDQSSRNCWPFFRGKSRCVERKIFKLKCKV